MCLQICKFKGVMFLNTTVELRSGAIKVRKKIDKKLLRIKDVTLQLPNIKKFSSDTGWKQEQSLDFSLRFLISELNKKN